MGECTLCGGTGERPIPSATRSWDNDMVECTACLPRRIRLEMYRLGHQLYDVEEVCMRSDDDDSAAIHVALCNLLPEELARGLLPHLLEGMRARTLAGDDFVIDNADGGYWEDPDGQLRYGASVVGVVLRSSSLDDDGDVLG